MAGRRHRSGHDPLIKYAPAAWKDHTWPMFVSDILKNMDTDPLPVRKKFVQMELDMTLAMFRAGVPFMAGTDTAAGVHIFPGFSLHQELALFVRPGLTPMQALQTATLNPAKFMNRIADLGTVEKRQARGSRAARRQPARGHRQHAKNPRGRARGPLSRPRRARSDAEGRGGGRRPKPAAAGGAWRRAMNRPRRGHRDARSAACSPGSPRGARARPRWMIAEAKPVTVADLLAGSPAADWRVPDPEDTLYMDLPRGRVVIELAARVAPQHAANIRALARAHYFDGLAIMRVQDNYVVQWDDPATIGPCRPACHAVGGVHRRCRCRSAFRALAGPRSLCAAGRISRRISRRARPALAHGVARALLWDGGRRARRSAGERRHRDVRGDRPCAAPARSQRRARRTGLEGHGAPLHPAARQRRDGFLRRLGAPVPIRSMRVAADVPKAERTPIEVLRTDSATFRAVLDAAAPAARAVVQVQSRSDRPLQRAAAGARDPFASH